MGGGGGVMVKTPRACDSDSEITGDGGGKNRRSPVFFRLVTYHERSMIWFAEIQVSLGKKQLQKQ